LRPAGSWVAVPTPFNSKNEVDFDVFEQIIDFHAVHHSSALLVMGSAGETTMLSMSEKRRIVRELAPYSKGKIPIFFGTTGRTTEDTIMLSQFAESQDADGVLFVIPPYITPPDAAVYDFLRTVIDSVQIPAAVYNNPSRVGVNIEPDVVVKLSEECENFVADKEAVGDVSQISEVLSRANRRLHLLCCDYPGYSILLPTLSLGGHGAANIGGNLIPEEMAAMAKPWESFEDVKRSREVYYRYQPLLKVLYAVTNPIMVKAAYRLLGVRVGVPRKPLPDATPEHFNALRKVAEQLGVLQKYRLDEVPARL
jgi:4-hydroxy-tetrahydrodipicolinate synthase